MSFNWHKYILLAEELIQASTEEAKLRSATSRAYYGSFNPCKIHKGYSLYKRGDVHEKVITEFKTSDVPLEVTIGNQLDDLRRKRNDSDYDGHYQPNTASIRFHISAAKRIIENLKEINAE